MNASNQEKDASDIDFGYKRVERDAKQGLVHTIFTNVASKYDVMNDVMSGGLHRLWKLRFVSQLKLQDGMHILDLAGGTGDIAFAILKRAEKEGKAVKVTVSDINADMLREGEARSIDRNMQGELEWVEANAEALPFEEATFDACTMAFGIRNVTDKAKALSEIYRVLKAPGQFLCLEFSPEPVPAIKPLYDLYSFKLIPFLGEKITQDRAAYQYLVESIRMFPAPAAFKVMIEDAGFEGVHYHSYNAGIVCNHMGWKRNQAR